MGLTIRYAVPIPEDLTEQVGRAGGREASALAHNVQPLHTAAPWHPRACCR
jgi:hypothetical protein